MKRVCGWVAALAGCVLFPILIGCQSNEKTPLPKNDPDPASSIAEVSDTEDSTVEVATDPTVLAVNTGLPRTIVIDGQFDDWEGLESWPWVGSGMTPSEDGVDDGEKSVSVTHDDQWVYLRVGLGTVMNAQGLDDTLSISFDADGNPLTGVVEANRDGESAGLAGVDFVLEFSPYDVKSKRTRGVGAYTLEQGFGRSTVNPYDLDVSFLPTHADNEIEIRLRRGVEIPGTNVKSFAGDSFSFLCQRTEVAGNVSEYTEGIQVAIGDGDSDGGTEITDLTQHEADRVLTGGGWMRKPAGGVRVMSWNIELGHMFTEPGSFARVFNAVRPDVICFQEMGRDRQTRDLQRWLEKEVPVGEGWDIRMRNGGDVAVATRLASVRTGPNEMPAIEGGKYPVRAALLLIGYGGKRIAVSSVHLKCCGRAGERSDQKRIAEATVIRDALTGSVQEDHAVGMLIMGDFNLVGSRTPLDNLMTGADMDGGDLRDISPLRLYDTTSTTWRDRDQPYLPGRLDFALVSDSTVRVMDSFVFDSSLLTDGELKASGVLRGDCREASDHLPIVVDLQW